MFHDETCVSREMGKKWVKMYFNNSTRIINEHVLKLHCYLNVNERVSNHLNALNNDELIMIADGAH